MQKSWCFIFSIIHICAYIFEGVFFISIEASPILLYSNAKLPRALVPLKQVLTFISNIHTTFSVNVIYFMWFFMVHRKHPPKISIYCWMVKNRSGLMGPLHTISANYYCKWLVCVNLHYLHSSYIFSFS